jgi:hypothetical protein
MKDEALKLALSCIRQSTEYKLGRALFVEAAEDVEFALAAPVQEPVAWMDEFGNVFPLGAQRGPKYLNEPMKPFYTTPPAQEFVCSTGLCHYKAQRTWVRLSEEEIDEIFNNQPGYCLDHYVFAEDVISKYEEKNAVAQLVVPDVLNPKDENPAYAAGWNDCRAEMLKEKNT